MSQAIGIRLKLGYAGSMTRSSDFIVQNRINSEAMPFGSGVMINPDNTVSAFGANGDENRFLGFAVRIVKQQQAIFENTGAYHKGELTDVMVRGSMAVPFRGTGTPTAAGAVFIRTARNPAFPNAQIGDVEAAPDGANTVRIPRASFATGIVEGGLVEVTVTERRI